MTARTARAASRRRFRARVQRIVSRLLRGVPRGTARREVFADGAGRLVTGSHGERGPAWGGSGVYWCSHCASWCDADEGAADDCERLFGPVCDSCAVTLFRKVL